MAEEKRKSEQSKNLFDNLTLLIQRVDKDAKFVYVNKYWLEVLEYEEKDLAGITLYDILREDQISYCKEIFKKVIAGKYSGDVDTVFVSKNGKEIYVQGNATAWFESEKFVSTIGIFRDVAEYNEAREKLYKSEQRFRDMVEITSDWIWEVDKGGKYIYVNPKVKELLGYDVDEVLGKTPFDFMPTEERIKVAKEFENIVLEKKPFHGLVNINRHKDGHLIVLETSGIPIFDKEGQLLGFRGIDRDITERTEAEALKDKMKELERLYKLMVGRELKMIELKKEISKLKNED